MEAPYLCNIIFNLKPKKNEQSFVNFNDAGFVANVWRNSKCGCTGRKSGY